MWYLFNKEKRDATRATFKDPDAFKGNPAERMKQLEEALNAALDELDARDSAVTNSIALILEEELSAPHRDMKMGKALLAEKRRIEQESGFSTNERELAGRFKLTPGEVLRLLSMGEKMETDLVKSKELKQMADDMETELGRPVTFEDLTKRTGLSWNDINRALMIAELDARGEL